MQMDSYILFVNNYSSILSWAIKYISNKCIIYAALLGSLSTVNSIALIAQTHPAFYTKTTSDGLQSNKVYSIFSAKSGLLYLAHSKGLSSFDGKVFRNFYCPKYPFVEVSNIMETDQGVIYCKSFNNQLFMVKGDTLDYLMSFENNTFAPSTTYQNKIIALCGDSIMFYNTITTKQVTQSLANVPLASNTKDIIFAWAHFNKINHTQELILVNKNWQISKQTDRVAGLGSLHYFGGRIFIAPNKSVKAMFNFSSNSKINLPAGFKNSGSVNYIKQIENTIWICTTNGLYYYDNSNGEKAMQYILPGSNISDLVKTIEGNYVISTLNSGLVFIPNFDANIILGLPPKIVTLKNYGNKLVIGTEVGESFCAEPQNKKAKFISKSVNIKASEFVLYDSTIKCYINSTNKVTFTVGKNNYTENFSIKDYSYYNQMLVLSASSGVYILSNGTSLAWLQKYVDTSKCSFPFLKKLRFFSEPVPTTKYDPLHQVFYCNTYNGIFEMRDGYAQPKQLPEPQNVVLADMGVLDGVLHLITKNLGILKLVNGKYHQVQNLPKDVFYKCSNYKNELWVLGEKAIYCLTTDTFVMYNNSCGIAIDKVQNISITNDWVYICNGDNVIQFPKYAAASQTQKPRVLVHSFINSDQKTAVANSENYDHQNNNFELQFSIIAFANADNIHLAYQVNDQKMIHLPNNVRQIHLNNLAPDNYVIKLFVVENSIVSTSPEFMYCFSISAPFYKTWWFAVLSILSLAALAYFIAKKRILQMQQQAALLESKFILEKELDKSILSSIKAQMNPHFLFNALNTIQSYVYMNDKKNAGMYISKFSNLTRSILEMSTKETIAIAEEVKALQLYLDLEKMRFEESFNYAIHVDAALSAEGICIPSMLVQPYVENAIKHGLLHKKTNRKLEVVFAKKANTIVITIDDNGIGRAKSKELNVIKNRNYNSFAMDANKKRIEILQQYHKNIQLQIIDKVDNLGEPLGTKVVIELPA
jgi:hypothetical protein